MLREVLRDQGSKRTPTGTRFRERGLEVSRLEGFSDAIFGFAITLVVVSLDVPRTFNDLIVILLGIGSFAVSFLLLIQIWGRHYRFFRRYGLVDNTTIALNMILLFLVLFYVYPLKFLFNIAINGLVAQVFAPLITPDIADRLGAAALKSLTDNQVTVLYIVYGLGFAAIYVLFALLYRHAYQVRVQLDLNELEIFETQALIRESLVIGGVGILSAIVALITHDAALPGFSYFVIAIGLYATGSSDGPRRKAIVNRMTAALPSAPAE